MGRIRFWGWFLSFSTSIISFNIYILPESAQKTANAVIASIQRFKFKRLNEKITVQSRKEEIERGKVGRETEWKAGEAIEKTHQRMNLEG